MTSVRRLALTQNAKGGSPSPVPQFTAVGLAAVLGGGIFGIQGSIRAGTLVGSPVLCNSARIRAQPGVTASTCIPLITRLACPAHPCLPQLALDTQKQGTRGLIAHVHPVQNWTRWVSTTPISIRQGAMANWQVELCKTVRPYGAGFSTEQKRKR